MTLKVSYCSTEDYAAVYVRKWSISVEATSNELSVIKYEKLLL